MALRKLCRRLSAFSDVTVCSPGRNCACLPASPPYWPRLSLYGWSCLRALADRSTSSLPKCWQEFSWDWPVSRSSFPSASTATSELCFFSAMAIVVGEVLWATGAIYSRGVKTKTSVMTFAAMQMFVGGIQLCLVGLVFGEGSRVHVSDFTPLSVSLCYSSSSSDRLSPSPPTLGCSR